MRNGRARAAAAIPELAMKDVLLRWTRGRLVPGRIKQGERVVIVEVGGDACQIVVGSWRDLLSLMAWLAPMVQAGLATNPVITPPERSEDYCHDDD
jgi:hypothetical protein